MRNISGNFYDLWRAILVAGMVGLFTLSVQAASIVKTNNLDALNLATSWITNGPPTASDVATWNSLSAGGSVSLGASQAWSGIYISSGTPSSVTITDPGSTTLTLGAGGINLNGGNASNRGITIGSPIALSADQTWTLSTDSGASITASSVISGNHALSVLSASGNQGTLNLNAANTFSGGLAVSNGIVKVGASSTVSGATVTAGAVGTGNLTLGDGTILASSSGTGYSVAAPVINIAGNITLGQSSGGTGRLSIDGTWNLGGATRNVTLGKASANWASGSEVFRFEQLSGFTVPTVTNGSLTLTTTTGSAATPSIARILNPTSFTNNTPLILDDGVAMSSGNGSFFIAGLGAPALTVNAPVSRGGGMLQMGDGVTGTTSNAVMRSAEIYSLSGGGTISATNFSIATNTLAPASGTLTINNGNSAVFSGVISDYPSLGKINLTKSGAGSQTFTGANAYNGTTTISGGSLFVNGTNTVTTGTAGYFVVNSGGTLGGSGLIDLSGANLGVTNKSGGKLSPGAASNTVGTLTFKLGTGALDISGTGAGGLVFDLAGTSSSDKIVLTSGTLNIGSGVLGWTNFTFNLAGNWQAGTYTLIQTPNTIAGTLGTSLVGTNAGFKQTIAISGNNLVVTMAPVSWTGNANTDFENNGNWGSGAAPANDLVTDTATFAGGVTANLPALTTSRNVSGLAFPTTTGGWTLSGPASDVLSLGVNGISSVGQTSGSNVISATLNVATNQTWKAGTGGALLLTGSITNSQSATNFSLTINAAGATGNVILSPAAGKNISLVGSNNSASIFQVKTGGLLELGGDGVTAPTTTSTNYILNTMTNSYGALAINAPGKVTVNSGTWIFSDLGKNGGDRLTGTLEVDGGTVSFGGARFLGEGTIQVNGGNLKVGVDTVSQFSNGQRFSLGSVATGLTNTATMNLVNGFVDLAAGAGNSIGGQIGTLFNQSGGTNQNGVTPGTLGGTTATFSIGGTGTGTNNNMTAYTLTGGKFISAGTVQGAAVPGPGSMNNFNFMGGTLAVAGLDATYLGSSPTATATANQTNVSLAIGTLANYGGTLAPGGDGTVGQSVITGNYAVSNNAAVLAIDIGGTNRAVGFQPGNTNYDYLQITNGFVALGGSLKVSLVGGFVPSGTDQYNIITCSGTNALGVTNLITGTFTNLDTSSASGRILGRVTVANMTNASFEVTINSETNTVYLSSFQIAGSTGNVAPTNVVAQVVNISGVNNVVITGSGGSGSSGFSVLSTTNLAAPINWVTNITGRPFGAGGSMSYTNPINPALPQEFYRISVP